LKYESEKDSQIALIEELKETLKRKNQKVDIVLEPRLPRHRDIAQMFD
jgi:hypothetical protein